MIATLFKTFNINPSRKCRTRLAYASGCYLVSTAKNCNVLLTGRQQGLLGGRPPACDGLRAIDDRAENLDSDRSQSAGRFLNLRPLAVVEPHRKDRSVNLLTDQKRVGEGQNGGRIDDDEIVLGL